MATIRAKLNAVWHEHHAMPERATTAQRIAWHLAHQKHCACRPIPPKLAKLIALHERAAGSSRTHRGTRGAA